MVPVTLSLWAFLSLPAQEKLRVCSESLGQRVHPLSMFTFPVPASPSLLFPCHRAFKNILRLTLAVLPPSWEGDCPPQSSAFSLLVPKQGREQAARFG